MEEKPDPHRAGQLGKILPGKLDHVSYPQDGAERSLFRVETACLHVPGCQVWQEVPPGEERREAGPRVNVRTLMQKFSSSFGRQGHLSPDLSDIISLPSFSALFVTPIIL
jgi:hypothetical protein